MPDAKRRVHMPRALREALPSGAPSGRLYCGRLSSQGSATAGQHGYVVHPGAQAWYAPSPAPMRNAASELMGGRAQVASKPSWVCVPHAAHLRGREQRVRGVCAGKDARTRSRRGRGGERRYKSALIRDAEEGCVPQRARGERGRLARRARQCRGAAAQPARRGALQAQHGRGAQHRAGVPRQRAWLALRRAQPGVGERV